MKIIINKKLFSPPFTDDVISVIVEEIRKCPEPVIIPIDTVPIEDIKIGLCMEKEVIYVDELHPENTIEYLGTKNVRQCVVAYIHSGTDHLVIHCNGCPIDFTPWLEKFKYKNDLSVSLAGGLPGSQASKDIVRQIVTALCRSVQKLNITVSVTNQKIIDNNKHQPEDRRGIAFYALMNTADICSRQFFHVPLDKQLANKKLTDLTNNIISESDRESLMLMIVVLKKLEEIHDVSKKTAMELLKQKVVEYIKTEQRFIQLVDALFTVEGFKLWLNSFHSSSYPPSHLIDFVFNLKNGNIYKISPNRPSRHELLRQIACFDGDSVDAKEYVLCYEGETKSVRKPILSQGFIHASYLLCSELSANMPFIKKDEVEKKYHFRDFEKNSNLYGRFIKFGLKDLFPDLSLQQVTFFNHPKNINDFYHKDEIKNENLKLLNRLTNCKFIGKNRHYPKHTVDAILNCNNQLQAKKIQALLEDHQIKSTLIKFNRQNNYTICVPAINVEYYSRTIRESASMKLVKHFTF